MRECGGSGGRRGERCRSGGCGNAIPPPGTEKGGLACPNPGTSSPPGRFAGAVQTRGYVDRDGQLHCVSPLLYEIGLVSLEISLDAGKTFPCSGTWTSGEDLLRPPRLPTSPSVWRGRGWATRAASRDTVRFVGQRVPAPNPRPFFCLTPQFTTIKSPLPRKAR